MQDREIKFRAWDGLRMIHFQDFSIGLAKGKKVKPYVYFLSDTFEGQVKFGKHQIMQWSGLVDKNGIEIYEGDIFKYSIPDDEVEFIEEVNFNLGSFDLDNAALGSFYDCGIVIGNIYENPELLSASAKTEC